MSLKKNSSLAKSSLIRVKSIKRTMPNLELLARSSLSAFLEKISE